MKTLLVKLFFRLIIFGALYALISFICAEANPLRWHWIARLTFVLLLVGDSVWGVMQVRAHSDEFYTRRNTSPDDFNGNHPSGKGY